METKYGKLVGGEIEYAPASLDTGSGKLMNPTEASYFAAGWKRWSRSRPRPRRA